MKSVLVVGCGGTGSEIIKLLFINKNLKITCIDYDKVDVTNLNRQFYFTKKDIGKYKAEVIGQKLNISYIVDNFKNKGLEFFNTFEIIFGCLDTISSRMELNFIVSKSKCQIFIDLGVSEFLGHSKIITDSLPCLYCIKDLFKLNNDQTFCSITKDMTVTKDNRSRVLNTLIVKEKENETDSEGIKKNRILNKFNKMDMDKELNTNFLEVDSLYNNIVPNSSIINSIMASLGFYLLIESQEKDFLFYNGEESIHISQQKFDFDENCIVCKNNLYQTH